MMMMMMMMVVVGQNGVLQELNDSNSVSLHGHFRMHCIFFCCLAYSSVAKPIPQPIQLGQ